jgi:hypothetical protein
VPAPADIDALIEQLQRIQRWLQALTYQVELMRTEQKPKAQDDGN